MYTCKIKYSKGEKKIFNNLQKQLQFILNYKFNYLHRTLWAQDEKEINLKKKWGPTYSFRIYNFKKYSY